VLQVTHGFPHPGQIGGHRLVAARGWRALIGAASLPITGAMFWTSPHARLLALVVGSAVALALLAISPARRTNGVETASTPAAKAADATPGSRAHVRQLYRLSLQSAVAR